MGYFALSLHSGRPPFLSQKQVQSLDESFPGDVRFVLSAGELESLKAKLPDFQQSGSGDAADWRRFFDLGNERFVAMTLDDSMFPAPDNNCVKGDHTKYFPQDVTVSVDVDAYLDDATHAVGAQWVAVPFEGIHLAYSNKKCGRAITRCGEWLKQAIGKIQSGKINIEQGKRLLFPVVGRPGPNLEKCVKNITEAIKQLDDSQTKAVGLYLGNLNGLETHEIVRVVEYVVRTLQTDHPTLVDSSLASLAAGSPLDVLRLWQAGVNTVESTLPCILTKLGQAFCFETDLSKDGQFRLTMNLRDREFARDGGPLRSGCRCWVCANHTRSYIHHLLNCREMLAEMLLFFHNTYQMLDLAKSFRACSSAEDRDAFIKGWESLHSF